MTIDKEKLLKLYMQWVDKVLEECDWKTHFGPEEIVHAIANLIENNPNLVIIDGTTEHTPNQEV